jgi:hypothetical protein
MFGMFLRRTLTRKSFFFLIPKTYFFKSQNQISSLALRMCNIASKVWIPSSSRILIKTQEWRADLIIGWNII